jgi:hypothetical protein
VLCKLAEAAHYLRMPDGTLRTIRRPHGIELREVRKALTICSVERYGKLINASREGRHAMKEILGFYLKRIEWDAQGIPIKLYPFTRDTSGNFFRRPVITGTGIPVSSIYECNRAGDSRRARAGLPFGDQCDRKSNPLRSRLTGS